MYTKKFANLEKLNWMIWIRDKVQTPQVNMPVHSPSDNDKSKQKIHFTGKPYHYRRLDHFHCSFASLQTEYSQTGVSLQFSKPLKTFAADVPERVCVWIRERWEREEKKKCWSLMIRSSRQRNSCAVSQLSWRLECDLKQIYRWNDKTKICCTIE